MVSWKSKTDLYITSSVFAVKIITDNVQGYVFLGGHKLLHTPLVISLPFFLQGYHKGLYRRGVRSPPFPLLRWPKMATSNEVGTGLFSEGTDSPISS